MSEELSFRYTTKPKYKHMTQYKYTPMSMREYSFKYNKNIALSDTRVFNGPIAITKVAVGLLNFNELFIFKGFKQVYQNNEIMLVKDNKEMVLDNYIFLTYDRYLRIYDNIFMSLTNKTRASIYRDATWCMRDNYLDIYHNIFTSRINDNDVKYYDSISFNYRNNDMMSVYNEYWLHKIKGNKLDIFDDVFLNRYRTLFSNTETWMSYRYKQHGYIDKQFSVINRYIIAGSIFDAINAHNTNQYKCNINQIYSTFLNDYYYTYLHKDVYIDVERKSFEILYNFNISIDRKSFNAKNYFVPIWQGSKSFEILDIIKISLHKKSLSFIDKTVQEIYRKIYITNIYSFCEIYKKKYKSNMIDIINVYKNKQQSNIDDIYTVFKTNNDHLHVFYNVLSSKVMSNDKAHIFKAFSTPFYGLTKENFVANFLLDLDTFTVKQEATGSYYVSYNSKGVYKIIHSVLQTDLFGNKNEKYVQVHCDFFGNKNEKYVQVHSELVAKLDNKTTQYLQNQCLNFSKDSLNIHAFNNVHVNKYSKELHQLFMYYSGYNTGKYIYTTQSLFSVKFAKQSHYIRYSIFANKQASKIFAERYYLFANKNNKNIFDTHILYGEKERENIFYIRNVYGNKDKKDTVYYYGFDSFTKDSGNVSRHNNPITAVKDSCNISFDISLVITKYDKDILLFNQPIKAGKDNQMLSLYMHSLSFEKQKHDIVLYRPQDIFQKVKGLLATLSQVTISKMSKSIKLYDNYLSIYKNQKCLGLYKYLFINIDNDGEIHSNRYSMEMYKPILSFYKKYKSIDFYIDSFWSNKISANASLLWNQNSVFIKKSKFINSELKNVGAIKTSDNAFVTDISSVIKQMDMTELLNIDADTIIPVSKIRHNNFVDKVNHLVTKKFGNAYVEQMYSCIEIPRSLIYNNILLCDKKEHRAFMEYAQLDAAKKQFKAYIQKNMFLDKTIKRAYIYEQIYLYKTIKQLFVNNNLIVYMHSKHVNIDESLFVTQGDKILMSLENLVLYQDSRNTNIYNSSYFVTQQKNAYYFYDITDTKKDEQHINIHHNSSINVRKDAEGFYEYTYIPMDVIKQSELFSYIQDMKRESYSFEVLPQDYRNWAWVYETPDPLEGEPFGIDELLLPERDTRYKDFIDLIFDKETMSPKNPVKSIDETTFIAKLPNKHPIPDYEEIGIVYIDVRTELMHEIYLQFYRIWQAKLFEFSTMTMVQSCKTILNYLYSWIMTYYPSENLKEALRVFRQIRWFAETAIIQNSQYIVSYEYGTLKSNLTSGACDIPNDLDYGNDTMYIDKDLGVIRNKYWNCGMDAYVTFEINNKKNSQFKFSLINTIGSVNIYINDVLVDTVSTRGTSHLSYDLLYQGDVNYVTIKKAKESNIDERFFIGNIEVPNASFKDLSVNFDPSLKAGNKPLNIMAKKMIAFANLADNPDMKYQEIRKANLSITETYKRMQEYWDLHHQNKTKGKRLTIKEI